MGGLTSGWTCCIHLSRSLFLYISTVMCWYKFNVPVCQVMPIQVLLMFFSLLTFSMMFRGMPVSVAMPPPLDDMAPHVNCRLSVWVNLHFCLSFQDDVWRCACQCGHAPNVGSKRRAQCERLWQLLEVLGLLWTYTHNSECPKRLWKWNVKVFPFLWKFIDLWRFGVLGDCPWTKRRECLW